MSTSKALAQKTSPYIGDSKLLARIRKYLEEQKHRPVHIDLLVDHLQFKYSEYARKKKSAFKKSVQKAHQVVCRDRENTNTADSYDNYEETYLKNLKNQQQNAEDKESMSESPDFSDGNEDYIEYKDTNAINSFMSDMYKKSNKRTAGSAPASAASSPKRPDIGSQVPDLGRSLFILDRTGSAKKKQMPPANEDADSTKNPKPKTSRTSNAESAGLRSADSTHTMEKEVGDKSKEYNTEESLRDDVSVKSATSVKKKKKGSDKEVKKKGPELQLSTVTFADVGGNDKTLMEVCKLLVHMKHPEVYQQLGVTPPRGFLLHGPPGCGKTLLANAIAGELNLPYIKMAATEVVSGVSGESEEKLRDIFEKAVVSAPCVLFIDEIDSITQKRENASKDMERRIVAQLLTCMDDLNSKPHIQVLVIGATNRADSIDPALRRAGRFDREICMGIPDEKARQRILEVLCRGLRLSECFNFPHLAHNTPGYVGADLMALSREAAIIAVNRVFNDLQQSAREGDKTKTTSSSSHVSQTDAGDTEDCLQDTMKVNRNSGILNRNEDTVAENSDNVIEENTLRTITESEMETDYDCVNEGQGTCDSSVEIEGPESQGKLGRTDSQVKQKEEGCSTVLNWLKDQPPLTVEQLSSLYITMEDFQSALKLVQPSAKREGFATIPDVSWEDIGALKDIREELELAIMAPVRHPEQFKALGLTSPPGILLAGPPGCGKTLLAKAVANESGINFISVKGPELLNMYVGESERAVRQVFQRARNSAPCVIFFDELDALCPRRSDSGEGGASVRVVNQLLTEMDGLEERKQVFIMGATNRPDIIDPAILRPGRLDKQVYVGLPGVEDRTDILKTITKNGSKPKLMSDVILYDVAGDSRCECFTGADLAALVREASVLALKQYITSTVKTEGQVIVSKQHFDLAFSKVKPSVSVKDLKIYEKMRKSLDTT